MFSTRVRPSGRLVQEPRPLRPPVPEQNNSLNRMILLRAGVGTRPEDSRMVRGKRNVLMAVP